MTSREFFVAVANSNVSAELIAFANESIAKLDAKNEKRNSTVSSKRAEENAPIIKAILDYLGEHKKAISSDIATACGISTSKMTGLGTSLKKDGVLVSEKIKVKGKGEQTAWSLADND